MGEKSHPPFKDTCSSTVAYTGERALLDLAKSRGVQVHDQHKWARFLCQIFNMILHEKDGESTAAQS